MNSASHNRKQFHFNKLTLALSAACAVVIAPQATALKYAAPQHTLKADAKIPAWQPDEVKSEPEEEVAIVGADIMDEIVLGWIRRYL